MSELEKLKIVHKEENKGIIKYLHNRKMYILYIGTYNLTW